MAMAAASTRAIHTAQNNRLYYTQHQQNVFLYTHVQTRRSVKHRQNNLFNKITDVLNARAVEKCANNFHEFQ